MLRIFVSICSSLQLQKYYRESSVPITDSSGVAGQTELMADFNALIRQFEKEGLFNVIFSSIIYSSYTSPFIFTILAICSLISNMWSIAWWKSLSYSPWVSTAWVAASYCSSLSCWVLAKAAAAGSCTRVDTTHSPVIFLLLLLLLLLLLNFFKNYKLFLCIWCVHCDHTITIKCVQYINPKWMKDWKFYYYCCIRVDLVLVW